jgi:hypothetical protein
MRKQEWKIVYRKLRIARREAIKAAADMMMYGTGAVMVPNDGGEVKHIPISDIKL